jgi:hypothetical protein
MLFAFIFKVLEFVGLLVRKRFSPWLFDWFTKLKIHQLES